MAGHTTNCKHNSRARKNKNKIHLIKLYHKREKRSNFFENISPISVKHTVTMKFAKHMVRRMMEKRTHGGAHDKL